MPCLIIVKYRNCFLTKECKFPHVQRSFFYTLILCSRAIWHSPHRGRQAITSQSSHTEPEMLYLLRMLVRRAIIAPGRKGMQQLSPLSWATLQARIQGTNDAQRQMPQSSQQSHKFELHSDNPEGPLYCVMMTSGCELITFGWNSIASSRRKRIWGGREMWNRSYWHNDLA